MSEAEAIARSKEPVTVDLLTKNLHQLGLNAGDLVLVHSSLSALGWVNGSAHAVILALENILGSDGTLVMPTHSSELSDPALWQNPPVPENWVEVVRATMPGFDPELTATRGMGIIPETFRKQNGVLRSNHPKFSFAARGPLAAQITANHALESDLGEGSPLAHLYDLDGKVLLLGVGHGNNTSLHLAEYRAEFPSKTIQRNGAAILQNGQSQWIWYDSLEISDEDFPKIGEAFGNIPGNVARGKVGEGVALLFKQRELVDFAVEWMQRHRL